MTACYQTYGEHLCIQYLDGEYIVPTPKDGGGYEPYFTDDKEDAIATLRAAWSKAGYPLVTHTIIKD